MTDDGEGLIAAYVLDGHGRGRQVGWDDIAGWRPGGAPLWVHLQRTAPVAERWLRERAGLDGLIVDALLAEGTRPRVTVEGDALLVVLRGVNLNPGADPEDMVSIRMWVERERIITVRLRHLMAVDDLRERLARGSGPVSCADTLVALADRLVDRMGPVVDALDENVDELQESVIVAESYDLRSRLSDIRRRAISLRRHLAPQREVLARLQTDSVSWLTPRDRGRVREIADRVIRYVEDLDAAGERAAVTQDELTSKLSEQMNRTMFLLSIVATIFLPLSLLTGLLGINVGGIPGDRNPYAFYIVTGLLVVLGVAEAIYFWKRRLL